MKTNLKESTIAFLVIGIIVIIIVPLSTAILDVLLVINISIALLILLNAMYVKEPLDFSTFPSILLIITLFRLSLNISSTRLILGNKGDAGKVIETFGNFVTKGNIVVGLIIFLIIIVIQFIVITKGAERVAEVAARFTLDSIPGKQMAIDADLNAGIINEREAKDRRIKVQREADFYGAMDGGSKFVKGDAIASIIITLINLIGGIIIGMVIENWEWQKVIEVYSLATVGDGLVSQIPALLISTATGIITTRSASKNSLNVDVKKQLASQHIVLFVGGTTLLLLNIVPGLPKIPLTLIGSTMLMLGYRLYKEKLKAEEVVDDKEDVVRPQITDANMNDLLFVDPITVEFGYSIISLVDEKQGGDLLERTIMMRRRYAADMGIIVPVVRFKDNMNIKPNEYIIKIKGVKVTGGQILADHMMAINTLGNQGDEIVGVEIEEPAFGMSAKWIKPELRDKAEMYGYTVVSPSSVIITHLTEIIKKNMYLLLGRQSVKELIDLLKEKYPTIVEEVNSQGIPIGRIQKVLSNLLQENISLKNLQTILETIVDHNKSTSDINFLTEYVRQSLKREITEKFVTDGKIDVISCAPELEQFISSNIKNNDSGSYLSIEPDKLANILANIQKVIEKANKSNINSVIITSPITRIYIKRLISQINSEINVISYGELENEVIVQVIGIVKMI